MYRLIVIMMVFIMMNTGLSLAWLSKEDKGTASAQFLKIGIGARAIGMGGAYVAVADDVNAVYWNPAGLTNIEGGEISLMHYIWFEDINYQSVIYAQNTKFGVIGAMINYLSMDAIDRRDNLGDLTGDFKPSDTAVTISYAREIGQIPIGINMKYIKTEIDDTKADAFAMDIGIKYELAEDKLNVGLSVQNIGSGMKYITKKEKLPSNIKAGMLYMFRLKGNIMRLAGDVNAPIDNEMGINLGAEYEIKIGENIKVMPRAGYKTENEELEGNKNISLGSGIQYKGYSIDYAWTPYGELGISHQISILVRFGKG